MNSVQAWKTTDLCDEYSDQLSICELTFNSYGSKKMFAGRIVTVDVTDDNTLVRESLETIPAGSVLVVNNGGSRKCAMLGDRLAAIAVSRGIKGVIINGCIRDSRDIAGMDVGVFALGTMPLKSRKLGNGTTNISLHFGGVTWTPGHYVYADEDGVVISETPLSL